MSDQDKGPGSHEERALLIFGLVVVLFIAMATGANYLFHKDTGGAPTDVSSSRQSAPVDR